MRYFLFVFYYSFFTLITGNPNEKNNPLTDSYNAFGSGDQSEPPLSDVAPLTQPDSTTESLTNLNTTPDLEVQPDLTSADGGDQTTSRVSDLLAVSQNDQEKDNNQQNAPCMPYMSGPPSGGDGMSNPRVSVLHIFELG